MPKAAVRSRSTNGPRVRAHRETSCGKASEIVATWAGMPGGMGIPRASRSRGASCAWARCSRPPMRTRIIRVPSWSRADNGTSVCSPSSSTGIGPSTRSRYATSSVVRARREGSVRCSWAWTSAMISGSSSSRSSTVPSSLAKSAGSRAKAAARFSANGESPSYINAPV